MIFEYWRRKFIPDTCPICGARPPNIKTRIENINAEYIAYLMREAFTSWRIEFLKKHPKWGIPCWIAQCMTCTMTQSFEKNDTYIPHDSLSLYDEPFILQS